ncbi:MAG: hypothetical protein BGO23_08220 [Solirubrobacterales bacterium 67-14]|nr:MAG: hypothetical protein BGO23_08220 [Solirubrobacterales bacterium 67-14]
MRQLRQSPKAPDTNASPRSVSEDLIAYSPQICRFTARAVAWLWKLDASPDVRDIIWAMGTMMSDEHGGLLRKMNSKLGPNAFWFGRTPKPVVEQDNLPDAETAVAVILWQASRETRHDHRSEVDLVDLMVGLDKILDPEVTVESVPSEVDPDMRSTLQTARVIVGMATA